MQPMNADYRLKELQLQKNTVEALLKAAPARAGRWRPTLTLLAHNWLREAEFSQQFARSSTLGPSLRRDRYVSWGLIISGISGMLLLVSDSFLVLFGVVFLLGLGQALSIAAHLSSHALSTPGGGVSC